MKKKYIRVEMEIFSISQPDVVLASITNSGLIATDGNENIGGFPWTE